MAASISSKLEPTIWSRDTGHTWRVGRTYGHTVTKTKFSRTDGLPHFLTIVLRYESYFDRNERNAQKIQPETGFESITPYDTGAALHKLIYQANWGLVIMWARNKFMEGVGMKRLL